MTENFVLVHGAWHGGWAWQPVASRLRAAGHRVWAPTCPGLGIDDDPRGVTLAGCIDSVVSQVEACFAVDVTLVGHSWGGYWRPPSWPPHFESAALVSPASGDRSPATAGPNCPVIARPVGETIWLAAASLRLEELAITEGSPLAGRSLQEMRGPTVPLLVRRPSGQLIANPDRELRLQAGDVLVVFGEASDLYPLDRD